MLAGGEVRRCGLDSMFVEETGNRQNWQGTSHTPTRTMKFFAEWEMKVNKKKVKRKLRSHFISFFVHESCV